MTPRPAERRLAAAYLLLLTALVGAALAATPGYEGDMDRVKRWTRWATLDGVALVYRSHGGYDPDYPPVTLYLDAAVGHAYRALVDPELDEGRALASRGLTAALKLAGFAFHLLLAALVFAAVGREASAEAAVGAAAVYALNPAALYDVGHWGQPDAVHSLWLALSVVALGRQQPGRAGFWQGLALLTKPQAAALAPILVFAAVKSGWRASARAAAGLAAGMVLPALPFIAAGRTDDLLELPHRILVDMPYVNACAHNFWWLATIGTNWDWLWAGAPALGPFTFREVSAALLALALGLVAWRFAFRAARFDAALAAPYLAFAWFVLTVQAHENHSFFVLPLLALSLHRSAMHRLAFAVVTVTLLLNMILHSPEVWGPSFDNLHLTGALLGVSVANAAANVMLLLVWTRSLVRSRAQAETTGD